MNISEKLNYLIKNGSAYGIFFMITSLEYNTIKDTMYYNDNILATFTNRFVFSLGNYDANNLIDDISLEGMDENMIYYFDENFKAHYKKV